MKFFIKKRLICTKMLASTRLSIKEASKIGKGFRLKVLCFVDTADNDNSHLNPLVSNI